MLKRQFGSTGVDVPVIGQGTWQMKSSGVEAMNLGIDLGMTHIDTAEMYTGAEEVVADVIRGRRKDVFLVSKVMPSNASYKNTVRACDASLKRLKTDYLDVYLVHWWSGTHPIEDTMDAFIALPGRTTNIWGFLPAWTLNRKSSLKRMLPNYFGVNCCRNGGSRRSSRSAE